MKVSVGAAGSLILIVGEETAAHFRGHGLSASAAVKDGNLALVFRSIGEALRAPHLRSIGGGDYQADFQYNHVKGWGRRCPKFRKQVAEAEYDGEALVATVPLEGLRSPILRGAARRAASTPVATGACVTPGELEQAVAVVNRAREQLGDRLTVSVTDGGRLEVSITFS